MTEVSNRTEPAVESFTLTINGEKRSAWRVKSREHTIEAVELDMAEQWDFLEVAGVNIENEAWLNIGLLAASVVSIDGLPVPAGPKTRDGLRHVLKKIGEDGIEALQFAFRELPDDSAAAVEASAEGN